jgi:hypothetical protein
MHGINMELPQSCKNCSSSRNDCPILFRANRTRKIRKKRFLIKKCPCNDCIIIMVCKSDCKLFDEYVKEKVSRYKKMCGEYFTTNSINWLQRNRIWILTLVLVVHHIWNSLHFALHVDYYKNQIDFLILNTLLVTVPVKIV